MQEKSVTVSVKGEKKYTVKNTISLAVNVISTFIVSVSVGMNAIIFPLTMKDQGLSNSVIGTILSLEIAASLLVCLLLTRILALLKITAGFIIASVVRVCALLALMMFQDTTSWIVFIFLHGVGVFTFLILLQTWANAIPFKKFKGLMVALYSTAISLGVAVGPLVFKMLPEASVYLQSFLDGVFTLQLQNPEVQIPFLASALISAVSLIPVLFAIALVPNFDLEKSVRVLPVIKKSPAVMFAVTMAGVSYFGVSSFITLYGIRNGLPVESSALLLTAFMLGSLILEAPFTFLSDFIDRRYMIMMSVLVSIICAVALPITIYQSYQAYALLFIWGGIIGVVYSVTLTILGERHRGDELVAANAGYSLMESLGGMVGVMLIGFSMDVFDSDGLPYIILFAGIVYFSYALTRYRVE